jgi:hypothetical protein
MAIALTIAQLGLRSFLRQGLATASLGCLLVQHLRSSGG